MWETLKRWFGVTSDTASPEAGLAPEAGSASTNASPSASQRPEVPWIAADANPWGVPVLDVRPVTATMLSTTTDAKCAENAVSFGQELGLGFVGVAPFVDRATACDLRYRTEATLLDGVLFTPREMEDKWALFLHQGQVLGVRSWTRTVTLVAEVFQGDGELRVTRIRGAFQDAGEPAEFTVRSFDALLRTHAIGAAWPVPLPAGFEADPYRAAIWCMSLYGRKAAFATAGDPRADGLAGPLRTSSLLHIAVARGDAEDVRRLAIGAPLTALGADGPTLLHWAMARSDDAMLDLLVDLGVPVDVRSAEGATALMNAAQGRSPARVAWLLARGADASARDDRGFTALHRAAEMGERAIVVALLAAGAAPGPAAHGHTPKSLASTRGHADLVAILEAAGG